MDLMAAPVSAERSSSALENDLHLATQKYRVTLSLSGMMLSEPRTQEVKLTNGHLWV